MNCRARSVKRPEEKMEPPRGHEKTAAATATLLIKLGAKRRVKLCYLLFILLAIAATLFLAAAAAAADQQEQHQNQFQSGKWFN